MRHLVRFACPAVAALLGVIFAPSALAQPAPKIAPQLRRVPHAVTASGAIASQASLPLAQQISQFVDDPRFANIFAGVITHPDGSVTIQVTEPGGGALAAALQTAFGPSASSDYQFVTVPNSSAALADLTSQITGDQAAIAAQGIHLASWGQDVGADTIDIEAVNPTAAQTSWLLDRYGSGLVTVTPVSQDAVMHRTVAQNRYYDDAPFNGGDRLFIDNNENEKCTDAFTMVGNATGNRIQITAGHCEGSSFWTNFSSHKKIGTLSSRHFTNNGDDYEGITCTSTCDANVWYDPPTIGMAQGYAYTVTSWCDCDSGLITFDGATTGEHPDSTVIAHNVCIPFDDGYTTCNLNEATKSGVELCGPGDSGGPVYLRTPNNTVSASGEIVGTTRDEHTCAYQRIRQIMTNSNLSVLSG